MDKFVKVLLTINTTVLVVFIVALFWFVFSQSGLSLPSDKSSLGDIKSSEPQKTVQSASLTAAEDGSLQSIDEAIELLKNTPEIQEIWQEGAEASHCSAEEQELTNSLAYGFGIEIKQEIKDTDSPLTIKRKTSLFECSEYNNYDLFLSC